MGYHRARTTLDHSRLPYVELLRRSRSTLLYSVLLRSAWQRTAGHAPGQGGPSTVTNPSSPGQPGKGSPPPAWPIPQKSPTPGQPKPGTKEPGPPQPQKPKDPPWQPPKK